MLKRGKSKNKLFTLIIVGIMVLTMIPTISFAGENNAEDFPSST